MIVTYGGQLQNSICATTTRLYASVFGYQNSHRKSKMYSNFQIYLWLEMSSKWWCYIFFSPEFSFIFIFQCNFFSLFLHKYKKMVWVWLRNLNQNVFISIFWSQDIYESSSKIKLNIKQQNQEVGQDVEINHNRKYSTIYFSYIE